MCTSVCCLVYFKWKDCFTFQADVAPLMSCLIGIPYPLNSEVRIDFNELPFSKKHA